MQESREVADRARQVLGAMAHPLFASGLTVSHNDDILRPRRMSTGWSDLGRWMGPGCRQRLVAMASIVFGLSTDLSRTLTASAASYQ